MHTLASSLMIKDMLLDDVDWLAEQEVILNTTPWTLGNFRDALKARYICRILWRSTIRVGYIVVSCGVSEAEILILGISADMQGQGFAYYLVGHTLDSMKNNGAKECFLEVRNSNLVAQQLYAKLGFKVIATRKDYYARGTLREDALVMRKML